MVTIAPAEIAAERDSYVGMADGVVVCFDEFGPISLQPFLERRVGAALPRARALKGDVLFAQMQRSVSMAIRRTTRRRSK